MEPHDQKKPSWNTVNIWSKKKGENLSENEVGVSVKTMGLENECCFWLREMKLLQRTKKESSCRVWGVNAAPGDQNTERCTV